MRTPKPMHPPGRPTIVGLQHGAVTLEGRSFQTRSHRSAPMSAWYLRSRSPGIAAGASAGSYPRERMTLPAGWVSDMGMSCLFTRRYWGNRRCFLLLSRLICLS